MLPGITLGASILFCLNFYIVKIIYIFFQSGILFSHIHIIGVNFYFGIQILFVFCRKASTFCASCMVTHFLNSACNLCLEISFGILGIIPLCTFQHMLHL